MPLLLPELIVPMLVLFGAFVLIGLAHTLTAQQGSSQSHSFWYYLSGQQYWHKVSGWVASFSRYIVSHFASAQLHLVAHWFKALGTLVLYSYGYQADQAEVTRDALRDLYTNGDRTARREAHRANKAVAKANTAIRHTDATVARDAKALNRYKAVTTPRVNHATHAVDVVIPRDIAGLRARNKALEKGQTKTNDAVRSLEDGAIDTFKWIRTHPLTATTGVFAGAVSIALARLGLGGLRCNNFKNLLSRYGCGLGTLLGRLLPLAVFLAIAFDFKDFVKASEVVASGIGDAVGKIEGTYALSLPPLPPPQG